MIECDNRFSNELPFVKGLLIMKGFGLIEIMNIVAFGIKISKTHAIESWWKNNGWIVHGLNLQ